MYCLATAVSSLICVFTFLYLKTYWSLQIKKSLTETFFTISWVKTVLTLAIALRALLKLLISAVLLHWNFHLSENSKYVRPMKKQRKLCIVNKLTLSKKNMATFFSLLFKYTLIYNLIWMTHVMLNNASI